MNYICENCNETHDGSYGSGRFCNNKCAKGFSTKNKRQEINKKISSSLLKNNKKYCTSCNVEISKTKAKYCKECLKYTYHKNIFKKLNITTSNLKDAENIAYNILYDLYFNKKWSKSIIEKEYGILTNTIYNFFKLHNVELRDLSNAQHIALLTNRKVIPLKNKNNYNYKCGLHTTWDNKEVYYRSLL